MRRFVILGGKATSSGSFSLSDIPGTSGRLDVLLRCLRAGLLVSHGLRQDTVVYLVLLGGPPRVLRFDGAAAKYIRPDERSLATTVKKALAVATEAPGFAAVRPGIAVASGGLEAVLADAGQGTRYLLEESGADVRGVALDMRDPVFFVGDHVGIADGHRAELASHGAVPISVGPVSVHAEDVITLLSNELDRRGNPAGS